MEFWVFSNVDGDAVSDADVKINLMFWRDVDDGVDVIEIADRYSVLDISILDKDFDWFDVSFRNQYCSWLMSSLDCDLITHCSVKCRVL